MISACQWAALPHVHCLKTISSFLEWAIKERSASESIEHYADDFLFAGRADSSECTNLMSNFSSLCQELGVPLAVEKTI
jgi:hypothetical protein